ncbi:hypothetical protein RKD55_003339 [Rossellomorea marisflavi]
MTKVLSKLFGVKQGTIKPMYEDGCQSTESCSTNRLARQAYRLLPTGKLIKNGCC